MHSHSPHTCTHTHTHTQQHTHIHMYTFCVSERAPSTGSYLAPSSGFYMWRDFYIDFFFLFFPPKHFIRFKKQFLVAHASSTSPHSVPSHLLGFLGLSPHLGSSGGLAVAVAGWTRWERQGAGHPLPTLPPTNYFLPWGGPTPWDSGQRDRWTEGAGSCPHSPAPSSEGCWAWICGSRPVQAFLSCSVSLLNLIKCSGSSGVLDGLHRVGGRGWGFFFFN